MIIGLDSAKEYLSINSPNQDVKIQTLVDYVNDFIIEFCSIEANEAPITKTRRVTSASGRNAVLPSTEITQVISVTSNGELLEEEDYYLDTASGILVFYTDVTTKLFGIVVEYEIGPYVPKGDLKLAALELLKYFYKDEYKGSVSSGQGDSISFEVAKSIPNKIRHILIHNRVL